VFASCSTIGSCRSTATFIIVKRGWSGFPVRRAITIRMLGFSFGLALVKCTKCYLMELPSLSYRRLRGDLIETFQYLHGIYRTNSSTVLPLAPTHDGTRGHSLKLHKRECRTSLRANVLGFRIVNFWNSMPEDIVSAHLSTASKDVLINIMHIYVTVLNTDIGFICHLRTTGPPAYMDRKKKMMMMMMCARLTALSLRHFFSWLNHRPTVQPGLYHGLSRAVYGVIDGDH